MKVHLPTSMVYIGTYKYYLIEFRKSVVTFNFIAPLLYTETNCTPCVLSFIYAGIVFILKTEPKSTSPDNVVYKTMYSIDVDGIVSECYERVHM